jgi:hypothetical protein
MKPRKNPGFRDPPLNLVVFLSAKRIRSRIGIGLGRLTVGYHRIRLSANGFGLAKNRSLFRPAVAVFPKLQAKSLRKFYPVRIVKKRLSFLDVTT